MPQGKCKLCLNRRDLQDSHLLPAALYKMTLDPRDKNPHPVLVTQNVALRTSKQLKDYVLCSECEQRFNENGERWMMSQVDNGKDFPLLDRLNVALPFRSTSGLSAFSGTAAGIDTDKLAYFVLGVLWRASVHKWKILRQTTSIKLGPYEEPVRRYLLGETRFPSNTFVVAIACTDFASRCSFYVPGRVRVTSHAVYFLLTRGVYFRVHMGGNVPREIRELCCVTSAEKFVFTRNCENKTVDAFGHLLSTAKPAPGLR